MPSLGADMESGTLIEWLVKPGDRVHRGDIVAVVETDKGAIEIEIFEDAIVARTAGGARYGGCRWARRSRASTASVSASPARPALRHRPPPAAHRRPSQPPPASAAAAGRAPALAPAPAARPAAAPLRRVSPSPRATRRKISPAARQHARERGIDLDRVVGTGDGGVVTVADVERFAARRAAGAAPPTAAPIERHRQPRRHRVSSAGRRRARPRDAARDRGRDESLEAGDSALLPRAHDRPRTGAARGSSGATRSGRSNSGWCTACCC